MYALYGHPIHFKFKQKYQEYGPSFQAIFPFLMTMITSTHKAEMTDITYFAKSKFSRNLVHKKNFDLWIVESR